MAEKVVVHYSALAAPLAVGYMAVVYPVDHPSPLVRNKEVAYTTPVQKINDDGSFETKNTKYVPVDVSGC